MVLIFLLTVWDTIICVYLSHSTEHSGTGGEKRQSGPKSPPSYFLSDLCLKGIYQVQRAPGRLIPISEQGRSPQEIRSATTESKAHPVQGSLYSVSHPAEESLLSTVRVYLTSSLGMRFPLLTAGQSCCAVFNPCLLLRRWWISGLVLALHPLFRDMHN